jgi:hypothetical protein
MRMRMRHGITVHLNQDLRALLMGADEVEVRAWVSRQTLDKAARWGWDPHPTHLSVEAGGTRLAVGELDPVPLSNDDVPMAALTIRGLALRVLRHFLAENEGNVTLHLGPSSLGLMNYYFGDGSFPEDLELIFTAHDRSGYSRVTVWADGTIGVKESWGEPSWWDAWTVSPDGEVTYVGTVDGPRYLPMWLARALEAKAEWVSE